MTLQKLSHTFTKIEFTLVHSKSLHILLVTFLMLFINNFSVAQELPSKGNVIVSDTPPQKPGALNMPKSSEFEQLNTEVVDTIKPKDSILTKETLTDIVKYKAKEYIKINRRKQQMYLYDTAEINYGDLNIQAGKIIINYGKSEIYAFGIKDSTGYTQAPVFKQGTNVVEPDSIRYNFKTQKALIFNSRTEQTGMNLRAEVTKKENDSVYYVKN